MPFNLSLMSEGILKGRMVSESLNTNYIILFELKILFIPDGLKKPPSAEGGRKSFSYMRKKINAMKGLGFVTPYYFTIRRISVDTTAPNISASNYLLRDVTVPNSIDVHVTTAHIIDSTEN
jgi:hypothetical protein